MPKLFGYIPVPGFGINFTKSETFEMLCKKAFDDVDVDKDSQLNFSELYVAILKLYDLLNGKLPCRLRIPKTQEMADMMTKFDTDKSGKLAFPEFLSLCRSLAGGKGRFIDSLFFKASAIIALKLLLLPLAAVGIKEGLKLIPGVPKSVVDPVPKGALAFGLEMIVKSNTPLPL